MFFSLQTLDCGALPNIFNFNKILIISVENSNFGSTSCWVILFPIIILYRIKYLDKDSFLLLERRNTLPYKHSLLAIFKAENVFSFIKNYLRFIMEANVLSLWADGVAREEDGQFFINIQHS